jgi:hypothetical protein
MAQEVTLSDDERAALDALLPGERQSGDLRSDLAAAIRESWRRREENTRLGAAVIAALYRDARSWRIVEYLTGVPRMTARRWATPPREADADREPTAADD